MLWCYYSAMQREIVFYKTTNNKCPVEDFLGSLPPKAVQKVAWVLRLLVQLDRVPAQYFCKMERTDDIWECRIKLGSDIYRIFAFWDSHQIILTHGLVKKTQKTPQREIEKAEKYKKNYWQSKEIDKG